MLSQLAARRRNGEFQRDYEINENNETNEMPKFVSLFRYFSFVSYLKSHLIPHRNTSTWPINAPAGRALVFIADIREIDRLLLMLSDDIYLMILTITLNYYQVS